MRKKNYVSVLLAVLMMLQIGAAMAMPVNAITAPVIILPDSGFISKTDPPKLEWYPVSGAAGYRLTIVNAATGQLYSPERNLWVGTTSYDMSDVLEDITGYPMLKIWVGAMDSSAVGANVLSEAFAYPTVSDYPALSTGSADDITANSATLYMSLDKNFGSEITDTGFYLGTSSRLSRMEQYSFEDDDNFNVSDKETKYMTITGLQPGTTYYYAAYSENGVGEGVGDMESFTTDEDTTDLSLSKERVSLNWKSSAMGSVTVTCAGMFSCEVEYDLPASVTENYDYEWLQCEVSDNVVHVSPLRANYSSSERMAKVTVVCGEAEKSFQVTQAACGEGMPSVQLYTYSSPTSAAEELISQTDLGVLNSTVVYKLENLYMESENVRKITVNVRRQNTFKAVSSDDYYPVATGDTTFFNVNMDANALEPGDYYVDVWASNSATANDFWAQKVQTTIFFCVEEEHVHSYEHSGYEEEHPHREYLACDCGYASYTGDTRYLATCEECNPAASDEAPTYDPALPLPELTGTQMERIVAVANSQVGYIETGNNHSVYGAYTGTDGYSWCAPFISWCANEAGLLGSDLPFKKGTYANPLNMLNGGTVYYFYDSYVGHKVLTLKPTKTVTAEKEWVSEKVSTKGKGFAYFMSNMDSIYDPYRTECLPQTGDIIYFKTGTSDTYVGYTSNAPWAHVGIIVDYEPSTKTITYVDGNGSNEGGSIVEGKGGNVGVTKWKIKLSASLIHAIARPNYSEDKTNKIETDYKAGMSIVTYDANGGTGAPAAQKANIGSTIAISTVEPERAGYIFLGWATRSNAGEAEYQPGDLCTVEEGTSFFAVWKEETDGDTEEYTFLLECTRSSATVSVTNNTDSNVAVLLIVAAYDSEGRQIACKMKNVTFGDGETISRKVDYSSSDGVSEIRAFLINVETQEPLYPVWKETL